MDKKKFLKRIIKFGIVGSSGIIVNSAVLWIAHDLLGLILYFASPVAIVAAIFNNFNLNDYWTWSEHRSERRHNYVHRLWRYYLSASLGAGLNYIVLITLSKIWGVYYLFANLVGIFTGMTTNFLLSEFWVFRRKELDDSEKSTSDSWY